MPMHKFVLAIAIVAIMAKMAMLAILTIDKGVIHMAVLGIQLKSIKN